MKAETDRTNKFLLLYNQVSDHLRKITGAETGVPFSQLVDRAAQKDSAVRVAKDQLKDYGDLRNAIVHHREWPQRIIAEPTEDTLSRFSALVQNVRSPRRLIPTFQREVRCFSPNERLVTALRHMRQHDYSQVVVQVNGQLSLLTVDGVARWLEQRADEEVIDISEATVEDALECESPSGFLVMSRNRTVYDAHDAFANAIAREQPRIFAIVITQTGKRSEQPLGIVTPWDLLEGESR